MMRIGIETESCHLWLQNKRIDIFGFIEKAAEFGYDGVMINIIEKKNQTEGLGALGADDPVHLAKVAQAIRSHGMFVELDTRGTDPQHLTHVLEIAELLGADVVRTFVMSGSGYSHGNLVGSFNKEAFDQAGQQLRELVPVLERKRIRLAIENHELETSAEILALVQQIGSPWVGVHLDVGNVMMAWEDPLEATRRVAPYTVTTHMKDHIICRNGPEGEAVVCGVPLGQGNLDLPAICRELYRHSTLQRLIIEMCYPYASPFQRPAGTGGVQQVGEGAFAVKPAPFPPEAVKPLDYYLYEGELLEQMLAAQLEGMRTSGAYLREICRQIENETNRKD